jgi:hypothetical protein
MLVDWACSLALLYLLHYFIIFIVNLNSVFVGILSDIADNGGNALDNFIDYVSSVALQSVAPASGFTGIVSTIIYALIVWQTLKFLVIYLKRMITIGFLIIISPLITITYSIDKIGDQKAQALNAWMKEFCYNILIQPFHCIMYLVFVDTAISLIEPSLLDSMFNVVSFVPGLDVVAAAGEAGAEALSGSNTMAAGILAVICLKFVDDGEKIIRKIFGFEKASSLSDAVTAAGTVTALASNAKAIGGALSKTTALGGNMFKSTLGKVGKNVSKLTGKVSNSRLGKAVGGAMKNAGNAAKAAGNSFAATSAGSNLISMGKKAAGAGKSVYKRAAKSVTSAKNFVSDREKFVNDETSKIAGFDSLSDDKKEEKRKELRSQYGKDHRAAQIGSGVRKTIGGAKGKVSSYLHDKNYMSSVIGATAGLAMYGMGSSGALASIVIGMGVKSSANQFLSNTSRQLGNDITESIQVTENIAGDFKNKNELNNHLAAVKFAGDSGAFNDKNSSAEVEKLLNTLQQFMSKQDALATAGKMQNAAMTDPNFDVNKYLDDVFKNANPSDPTLAANLNNDTMKDDAKNVTKDYLTYASNARTYNGLKTAEDAGLSMDRIEELVGGNMNLPDRSSTYTNYTNSTTEEVTITSQDELSSNLDQLQTQLNDMLKNINQDTDANVRKIEQTVQDIESKASQFSTPSNDAKIADINNKINDYRNKNQTN